jgi:hypothetical protein
MKKGEATGSQRKPKVRESEGEDEVIRQDDRTKAINAYESVRTRTCEEAEKLLEAVENLISGDAVSDPSELPLPQMRSLEMRLSELRVNYDQLLDIVQ